MGDTRHWLYVWANFWLQEVIVISIRGIKFLEKIEVLLIPIFTHGEKFAPTYTCIYWTQIS